MNMPESNNTSDALRLKAALVQKDASLTNAFCTALTDWIWNQRIGDLLDPKELAESLSLILDEFNLEPFLEHNIPPALAHASERLSRQGQSIRDWLPDSLIKDLEDTSPPIDLIQAQNLQDILPDHLVRDILGGALADTVEELIGKLPGSGGMLVGSLAKSASKFRARTGRWMSNSESDETGGFSGQLRNLSKSSADTLKQRVITRLGSPDHADELKAAKNRMVAKILDQPIERYLAYTDDMTSEPLSVGIQKTIVHNLKRREISEALRDQSEELLLRISDQKIGKLVSKGRKDKKLKERWAKSLEPIARGFVTSIEFTNWLNEAFQASDTE